MEMVVSLDEVKSSRTEYGKYFPNFEMLDAKITSALNIQKKSQPRGAESPKRGPVSEKETNRFHDLRLLSSDWRS